MVPSVLRVQDRRALQYSDVAQCFVSSNHCLTDGLAPQVYGYRELQSVQGSQVMLEAVSSNDALSLSIIELGNYEDLNPPSGNIRFEVFYEFVRLVRGKHTHPDLS